MNAVTQKSLLIIDDHPVYRDALSEKLTRDLMTDGIEVAIASSANEGLDLIQHTNKHWVILLDVMMPGPSGLSLCRSLRESGQFAVPVILLTAWTHLETAVDLVDRKSVV